VRGSQSLPQETEALHPMADSADSQAPPARQRQRNRPVGTKPL